MPSRLLSENYLTSETIASLSSWWAEVLWFRLFLKADDYGRYDARPRVILATCFPVDDKPSLDDIGAGLLELAAKGCIFLYEVSGQPYLRFVKWKVTPRALKSKYPPPPGSEPDQAVSRCSAWWVDRFEEFWKPWPGGQKHNRKVEKPDALDEWRALWPGEEKEAALFSTIMAALPAYLASNEPKYLLYPKRWLKKRRWEDGDGNATDREGSSNVTGTGDRPDTSLGGESPGPLGAARKRQWIPDPEVLPLSGAD